MKRNKNRNLSQNQKLNQNLKRITCFALAFWLALTFSERSNVRAQNKAQAAGNAVGIFEGHGDVGKVLHTGGVEYDPAKQTYTLAGGGENIWEDKDAFQYVWKKMSGDVTLTADVSFLTKGGDEHKKAVLMIRQSLDADSAYADVALHGSGLTSLQYRDDSGAQTQEIQSSVSAPTRLRLVKRGDHFSMWLVDENGRFQPATGSARVVLKEPFYVGIGMCSHNDNVVEKAVFSKVELRDEPIRASGENTLYSTLETIAVASTDRRVVYIAPERFEAPNWMPDARALLFNRDGHIEKIPVAGGTAQILDTGFATRCNNDHLISPDGTRLGISDNSQENHQSLVYIVPITGGTPTRITQKSPSYLHGWSPDGKTLAFVGEREASLISIRSPRRAGKRRD